MKLVINSSPRTGVSRLLSYLRIAYNRTELDKDNYGEYANREDFLLWAHSPVMLLANFTDVKQITLIRKPEDVVPSICNKVYNGIGLDIVDGVQSRSKPKYDDLEEFMNHFTYSTSLEYLSYLDNTIKNFNNLLIFSFDDIVKNIDLVVEKISYFDKNNYVPIYKDSIQEIDDLIHERWLKEEGEDHIYSNRGPIKNKSDSYYKFKEIYLNNTLKNNLSDSYNIIINKLNKSI